MSDHLLLMSIGPVQELIAQARRMRDLWFGSHVLSEVSMAAAMAMTERGATLVFPALDANDPRLRSCDELRPDDGTPVYNVANKLLALVPGDAEPVAEYAEVKARERLFDWGMKTLREQQALVDPAALDSAREQLETLLRVHAVWIRWSKEGGESYEHAREELEAELAARKTLHVFAPWARQRGGVHKSSLDGGRETVLRQRNREGKDWQRFRIGEREQLDAVGLLKRAGGKPEQFVPVPNIGLAAWLENAQRNQHAALALAKLVAACTALPRIRRDEAWVEALPYDAQILLPERWEPYLSEHGMSLEEAARFGRAHVKPLLDNMPLPYPYVACLVADGDRMGDAINALATNGPERHRSFSRTLSLFADKARAIVEKDHRGILVYAGGDDVLGFVCVQDALACADALRVAFAEVVREAMGSAEVKLPTLSVGIGIGHVLQSLGRLLTLGRDAERLAKRANGRKRNTLAVIHEKHSGMVRTWHASWDDDPRDRLRRAVTLLEDERLSTKKIFQIRDLLERTPAADEVDDDAERWHSLLRAEVQRSLARTDLGRAEGEPLGAEEVGLDLGGSYAELREHIGRWVEGMQIAIELMRAHHAAKVQE